MTVEQAHLARQAFHDFGSYLHAADCMVVAQLESRG